jgi:hypothetical protein
VTFVAIALLGLLTVVDPGYDRTRLLFAMWEPTAPPLRNINRIWNYVSDRAALGMWYLLALPVAVLWVRAGFIDWDGVRRAGRHEVLGAWRAASRPALAVVALVFLNGLSPYLGLKTETSFAMYSNLRTEPGFENHLFMPALALAPYQSELVLVTAASDHELRQSIGRAPLPLVKLRRLAAEAADPQHFQVDYVLARTGQAFSVSDASRDPVLGAPLSYAERKFLRFRDIITLTCSH